MIQNSQNENGKSEPHMNSAGHVTIRPDAWPDWRQWPTARIQKNSKTIRLAIRPRSSWILDRIPLCLSRQSFFLLSFKIQSCLKPNRLPTNHINLEIEPLQPKISHEHCQTCLYTYSYKFTTQQTMLNQNTFKILHPSRSYTKEY